MQTSPLHTTVGELEPVTFERFRICELFAELLHCSNMALLNRSRRYDNIYDHEGRLQGGLAALEQLGRIVTIGPERNGQDVFIEREQSLEPSKELPISTVPASSLADSDEDEIMSDEDASPGSSDEEMIMEMAMSDNAEMLSFAAPSSPNQPPPAMGRAILERTRRLSSASSSSSFNERYRTRSVSSRRSAFYSPSIRPIDSMSLGDRLKQRFQETNLLNTVIVRHLLFWFLD